MRRGLPWSDSWSSFLSGGLDSSSVVYALSDALGHSFPTFYGSFGNLDRYLAMPDEEGVARAVADRFGTHHSVFTIGSDAIDAFPRSFGLSRSQSTTEGPSSSMP